jgi:hypothetical protein
MKITKGREPTDQVNMALPPKFLAACRLVFGDDKPATIWGAIVSDDPRINEVRALAARDPKRWFVDPQQSRCGHKKEPQAGYAP